MAKAFLFDQVDSFTVQSITNDIKALGEDEELELHINSPGGDVFAGFALFSLLRSIPNKVITIVDGMAGSIASVIAMAGDEVHISAAGSFMVHNASVMRGGNKEQLAKAEAELVKIDKTILDIYVGKTRQSQKNIRALMDSEAIIDAKQALSLGFVDKITTPLKAVALINPNTIDMSLLEDVKNHANAILGLKPEEDSTVALLEAAEIVAEQKQAEKAAGSLGADLLTADMVKSVDYLADTKLIKDFVAKVTDFIAAQPTTEEINARIDAAVAEENKRLLSNLKSNTQIPRATTQPLAEQEQKESEDMSSFNNAFGKIKESTNNLYNN